MEIDSRRITDKDIWDSLEKYKFLIAKKIENQRNSINLNEMAIKQDKKPETGKFPS